VSVYKQPKSKNWWYKFTWNGQLIRESTKQANKRVAEQMEAAHKTCLAKSETGIREKTPPPTLREFTEQSFSPYVESRFANKPKTLEYYRYGVKNLLAFQKLESCRLDEISTDKIAAFVRVRQALNLQPTTINRSLEVLRRILRLAVEWRAIETSKVKVEMLGGERHRERVLSPYEENAYLIAAHTIGDEILAAYQRALVGLKAQRGHVPIEPEDQFALRDVATILVDCGLRPEECFRLRWLDVRDNVLHVLFGKTANARRRIPLTSRVAAILDQRRANANGPFVFPAETKTGYFEKSTLKKQHKKACVLAGVEPFTFYTFRHTCLTRWAEVMDPYTLAYLAGHSDFSTTKRYVHPQTETVLAAFDRAREAKGRHSFGHSQPRRDTEAESASTITSCILKELDGRGERIRTSGLLVPNQALYQAEPRPDHTQNNTLRAGLPVVVVDIERQRREHSGLDSRIGRTLQHPPKNPVDLVRRRGVGHVPAHLRRLYRILPRLSAQGGSLGIALEQRLLRFDGGVRRVVRLARETRPHVERD